jgi:ABC-type antimicrobial peptide transport system permease subunit
LGGQPEDANVQIVGVVADVQSQNRRTDALPHVFRPLAQAAPQLGWHTVWVVIRQPIDVLAVSEDVRSRATRLARGAALYDFATMEERLQLYVVVERHRAVLVGCFAIAALALTGFGLYGHISYFVSQKMTECAIRIAVGAAPADSALFVCRYMFVPICVGLLVGSIAAVGVVGWLGNVLYGVTATDPIAIGGAVGSVVVTSVAAAVLPMRRVLALDPMNLLRRA